MHVKRVLVATDFSPASSAAVTYAFDLAVRLGASVHLLHVIEEWALTVTYLKALDIELPGLRERVIDDAHATLRALATSLAPGGAPTTTEVREGRPADVIVDVARSAEADLVVVGTHGRTGVAHAVLGSVAERVVRTAPCPVLTVRQSGTGAAATTAP
jgi:universal stress protein A